MGLTGVSDDVRCGTIPLRGKDSQTESCPHALRHLGSRTLSSGNASNSYKWTSSIGRTSCNYGGGDIKGNARWEGVVKPRCRQGGR